MTWQRYNKNLRKSLLLAEYFSFWIINPYSEDIVLGIPQIFIIVFNYVDTQHYCQLNFGTGMT